jgi:hypothetical protein
MVPRVKLAAVAILLVIALAGLLLWTPDTPRTGDRSEMFSLRREPFRRLERAMGIEPTTRSLGIFWFIGQISELCDFYDQRESEHIKNGTQLSGLSADKRQARLGRLPMFSAASF